MTKKKNKIYIIIINKNNNNNIISNNNMYLLLVSTSRLFTQSGRVHCDHSLLKEHADSISLHRLFRNAKALCHNYNYLNHGLRMFRDQRGKDIFLTK